MKMTNVLQFVEQPPPKQSNRTTATQAGVSPATMDRVKVDGASHEAPTTVMGKNNVEQVRRAQRSPQEIFNEAFARQQQGLAPIKGDPNYCSSALPATKKYVKKFDESREAGFLRGYINLCRETNRALDPHAVRRIKALGL